MATKVKGGAIKEGSIPLSALANDVKDKLSKIFIMPGDFIEEQYNEPDEDGFSGKVKQKYVTDILENGYNKINILGVLGDINIENDSITITIQSGVFQFEERQDTYTKMIIRVQDCKFVSQGYLVKSPFVTNVLSDDASNVGAIRYNFVKSVTNEETTIPEENKQLFKKNMGSFADWNAQEGEAGYIANKPFYIISEDVSFINNYDYIYEHFFNHIPYFIDNGSSDSDYKELEINVKNDETKTYIFNGLTILVTNTDGYYRFEFNEDETFEEEVFNFVNRYIKDVKKKYLDSSYLPDTVIKTTPQTLSTNDKNQALANLGIDPVVWKYICSPYEVCIMNVDNSEPIPEDLFNIINNNPNIAQKVIVINYENSSSNYIGHISGKNLTDNVFYVSIENNVYRMTINEDRTVYLEIS